MSLINYDQGRIAQSENGPTSTYRCLRGNHEPLSAELLQEARRGASLHASGAGAVHHPADPLRGHLVFGEGAGRSLVRAQRALGAPHALRRGVLRARVPGPARHRRRRGGRERALLGLLRHREPWHHLHHPGPLPAEPHPRLRGGLRQAGHREGVPGIHQLPHRAAASGHAGCGLLRQARQRARYRVFPGEALRTGPLRARRPSAGVCATRSPSPS